MKRNAFFKQSVLVTRVLPLVAKEKCFALKGGTAINFFWRDLPRLSVDIDLAYCAVEPREQSLKQIAEALQRIALDAKKSIPNLKVKTDFTDAGKRISKLSMLLENAPIKIEPNDVIRGSVYPCETRHLSQKAEELFQMSATVSTLSLADLYGGKICAALDRQHPRDLFDVKLLLENEGITNEIRKAFVVYWASHDRPLSELINPTPKNILDVYEKEFAGMLTEDIHYEDLIETRTTLIKTLQKDLTAPERQFIISLKEGNPQWELMDIPHLATLPALQWKLANIRKMGKKKHTEDLQKLREILAL